MRILLTSCATLDSSVYPTLRSSLIALGFDVVTLVKAKPLVSPLLPNPSISNLSTGPDEQDRNPILLGIDADKTLADMAVDAGLVSGTALLVCEADPSVQATVWRQQLRVFSAIARLSAGEPVTQVAHAVGYDTHGAFSAVFRKITGLNPASYFPGKDGTGELHER